MEFFWIILIKLNSSLELNRQIFTHSKLLMAHLLLFIYGKDYKEIQQQYIALTGQPIMPPKWALGFAQSRGLYTKENQALEVAAEFRKRKSRIDIIYRDIGWTQNLQDFEWKKAIIPIQKQCSKN